MFCKKWINLYQYQLRLQMLSRLPSNRKSVNNPSIASVFHRLRNNLKCRHYCVESNNNVAFVNPSSLISEQYEMQECLENSSSSMDSTTKLKTYKERCIFKIKNLFKCSDSESLLIYQQYPFLFHENITETMKKISMFTNAGILERSIFKNIDILEMSDDEIAFRLEELNEWGLNKQQQNDALALLKLEPPLFYKLTVLFKNEVERIPERNRLIYLSRTLECSLEEAVELSMKYQHLLTRNFETVQEIFTLLLENGISPQHLQNNLWFTGNTLNSIKKWLNSSKAESALCNKFNIDSFNFLQKLTEKGKHERIVLKPNQSKEEFFAEKLQIDLKIVKYLMTEYPRTFNQDLYRITKVIDFLYSHGYTGVQICTNPSILNKDINLLQNRLTECRSVGCDIIPLNILCASKNKYKSYLETWKSDLS